MGHFTASVISYAMFVLAGMAGTGFGKMDKSNVSKSKNRPTSGSGLLVD